MTCVVLANRLVANLAAPEDGPREAHLVVYEKSSAMGPPTPGPPSSLPTTELHPEHKVCVQKVAKERKRGPGEEWGEGISTTQNRQHGSGGTFARGRGQDTIRDRGQTHLPGRGEGGAAGRGQRMAPHTEAGDHRNTDTRSMEQRGVSFAAVARGWRCRETARETGCVN